MVNNEEIEVCHSESTVKADDRFSCNPLIFIRINKPLKENAVLPCFSLEKFYEQDSTHGIVMEIVPNLSV